MGTYLTIRRRHGARFPLRLYKFWREYRVQQKASLPIVVGTQAQRVCIWRAEDRLDAQEHQYQLLGMQRSDPPWSAQG